MPEMESRMGQRTPRDPEDRPVEPNDSAAMRDKNLDKTIADSFPTSDPPSTVPDPAEGES